MSEQQQAEKSKEEQFQAIVDKMPTHVYLSYGKVEPAGVNVMEVMPDKVYACINFSEKGFGFGEIGIFTDKEGQTYIDSECMSREAVLHFLTKLVEDAILDTDEDPEKHAKYVKFIKQTCGEGCRPCQAIKKGKEKDDPTT